MNEKGEPIYWYLYGSDLESGGGFATNDLAELMEASVPENVNVVIETGGSSLRQNDIVDAEKTAVGFWNHGGDSVAGAAFDELYGNDSLTLDEMYAAFSSVWEPSTDNQPLELVGFDTCLMATVDVANAFCDLSHYLVASEETEPANGWYYLHWLQPRLFLTVCPHCRTE